MEVWPESRSGRLTPREKASDSHWIGGWVGSRGSTDEVAKRKISLFLLNTYCTNQVISGDVNWINSCPFMESVGPSQNPH